MCVLLDNILLDLDLVLDTHILLVRFPSYTE